MSETQKHIDLVKLVFGYIKKIVPLDTAELIAYDSPDSDNQTPKVGNYIPDVYYLHNDLLIIGEAKTLNDFERKHSFAQFETYIDVCTGFTGKAIVVICIPWELYMTAKNYFRKLKRSNNSEITIVIMTDVGLIEEV